MAFFPYFNQFKSEFSFQTTWQYLINLLAIINVSNNNYQVT